MNKPTRVVIISLAAFVGVVVVVLAIVPLFFEDRAVEAVRRAMNERLNAEVQFDDVDLSILATFPSLGVEVEGLRVVGEGDFEGEEILRAKSLEFGIDLLSLILRREVQVEWVRLEEPRLYARVGQDGRANYDIFVDENPEGKSEQSMQLAVREYRIVDAEIVYQTPDARVSLDHVNHEGSIEVSGATYELESETEIGNVSFEVDDIEYVEQLRVRAGTHAIFKSREQLLLVPEFTLQLDDLPFEGRGEMSWGDEKVELDVKLASTRDSSIKNLLSLVPTAAAGDVSDLDAGGSFAIEAHVDGRLGPKPDFPSFEVRVKVDEGRLQYPQLYLPISDVFVNATVEHPGGSLDNIKVRVREFKARAGESHASGSIVVEGPLSNARIDAQVDANVNLADIARAYPVANADQLSGIVEANVQIVARGENVRKLDGRFNADDVRYRTETLPVVHVERALIAFSPKSTEIEALRGQVGSSDFSVSGSVSPLTEFIDSDGRIEGELSLTSRRLDLADLLGDAPKDQEGDTVTIPENLALVLKAEIGKIIYRDLTLANVRANVALDEGAVAISDGRADALGGSLRVDGRVEPSEAGSEFDLAYSMKGIEFVEAFKELNAFHTLAPIAQYIRGEFSGEIRLAGELGDDFAPILNTIDGKGLLEANGTLSDFKPLRILAAAIPPIPPELDFGKAIVPFRVQGGRIQVREFPVRVRGFELRVKGSHGIDQDMSYVVTGELPATAIAGSQLAEKVESLGLDATRLTTIGLRATLTGSISDPQLSLNVQVPGIGETVKEAVAKGADEAQERVSAEVEKAISEAERQADQLREEAKRAAAKLKKEGYARAEQLESEGASDPLTKVAAEHAAGALRGKTDAAARRVVEEADKQAEGILREAKSRARSLTP